MNEILPLLYVGDVRVAEKTDMLLSVGIRGVVSCCTYLEKPLYVFGNSNTYSSATTNYINHISTTALSSSDTPSTYASLSSTFSSTNDTCNISVSVSMETEDSCVKRSKNSDHDCAVLCSAEPVGDSAGDEAAAHTITVAMTTSSFHDGATASSCCDDTTFSTGMLSSSSSSASTSTTTCTTTHCLSTSSCSNLDGGLLVDHSASLPSRDISQQQSQCHLTYFRVPIDDTSYQPINLYFEEAGDFIDSFLLRGEGVLVHCKAGVSRSVTIILSYLVGRMNFKLLRGFYHVLSRRKIICPNVGFMEQLCEYESEVMEKHRMRKKQWWKLKQQQQKQDMEEQLRQQHQEEEKKQQLQQQQQQLQQQQQQLQQQQQQQLQQQQHQQQQQQPQQQQQQLPQQQLQPNPQQQQHEQQQPQQQLLQHPDQLLSSWQHTSTECSQSPPADHIPSVQPFLCNQCRLSSPLSPNPSQHVQHTCNNSQRHVSLPSQCVYSLPAACSYRACKIPTSQAAYDTCASHTAYAISASNTACARGPSCRPSAASESFVIPCTDSHDTCTSCLIIHNNNKQRSTNDIDCGDINCVFPFSSLSGGDAARCKDVYKNNDEQYGCTKGEFETTRRRSRSCCGSIITDKRLNPPSTTALPAEPSSCLELTTYNRVSVDDDLGGALYATHNTVETQWGRDMQCHPECGFKNHTSNYCYYHCNVCSCCSTSKVMECVYCYNVAPCSSSRAVKRSRTWCVDKANVEDTELMNCYDIARLRQSAFEPSCSRRRRSICHSSRTCVCCCCRNNHSSRSSNSNCNCYRTTRRLEEGQPTVKTWPPSRPTGCCAVQSTMECGGATCDVDQLPAGSTEDSSCVTRRNNGDTNSSNSEEDAVSMRMSSVSVMSTCTTTNTSGCSCSSSSAYTPTSCHNMMDVMHTGMVDNACCNSVSTMSGSITSNCSNTKCINNSSNNTSSYSSTICSDNMAGTLNINPDNQPLCYDPQSCQSSLCAVSSMSLCSTSSSSLSQIQTKSMTEHHPLLPHLSAEESLNARLEEELWRRRRHELGLRRSYGELLEEDDEEDMEDEFCLEEEENMARSAVGGGGMMEEEVVKRNRKVKPSICMYKYIEWYTADRSDRPGVPDLERE
eukprot:GHVQ01013753.1.p1 GENE.GHVQ01013753.1~~GHVQ01013753.1.p1  ORF type:complete len:1123 (-),score=293.28 GHVQ01013753.1:145-3513(-)